MVPLTRFGFSNDTRAGTFSEGSEKAPILNTRTRVGREITSGATSSRHERRSSALPALNFRKLFRELRVVFSELELFSFVIGFPIRYE
jgi:hypothetical protein